MAVSFILTYSVEDLVFIVGSSACVLKHVVAEEAQSKVVITADDASEGRDKDYSEEQVLSDLQRKDFVF